MVPDTGIGSGARCRREACARLTGVSSNEALVFPVPVLATTDTVIQASDPRQLGPGRSSRRPSRPWPPSPVTIIEDADPHLRLRVDTPRLPRRLSATNKKIARTR